MNGYFFKSKFKLFLLLLGLATTLNGVSQKQNTRIFGEAPEYKNMAIVFEQYQNFLNHQKKELFTLEIDDNGHFDFTYQLDHITYAFADLGEFRGFIYLEPGKEYELKLPPFEPLSQSQKLNPFYQPEHILLGILNEAPDGLNPMIRNFNEAFDYQINTKAVKLITSRNKTLTQNIIDTLESRFPANHDFFKLHKHFRYARLEMLTSRNPQKDVVKKYFSDTPVMFSMPSYWETFKDAFKGYGRRLFSDKELPRSLDFTTLKETIKKDTLYYRTDLSETLVLWALYESYHEDILAHNNILRWLNEVSQQAETPEVKTTAEAVFRRINALRAGTKAPQFKLFDFSGKEKTLSDYEGKFVYLNFIHTDNHACRKDLKLLPEIYEEFNRDLEIVPIVFNEDYDKAKQFLNNNKFEWDFLHFGMNAYIIDAYNVKAVPLYYLINPEGRIVLSPAPTPDENFHDNFVDQYRKFRRYQQRNNSQPQKSIFN